MTLTAPTGNFSIGTSSTTGPATSFSVDMSLDDMIKTRRKNEAKKAKPAAGKKGPTTVQKALGRGKAKKAAAANARRGIQASAKPTPMQVEQQINRQQKKAKKTGQQKKTGTTPTAGGRRSRRVADVKAKEKAQRQKAVAKKSAAPGLKGPTRPPSKKAVNAAVNAMSEAGFKVPKGMKMVISFTPSANTSASGKKKGAGNAKNNKSKNSTNNSNKGGGRK